MLVDSLSSLRHLDLHEDHDPEESEYDYRKSFSDTNKNKGCIDSDQNVNNKFEIIGIEYCLNGKDLAYFKSQGTSDHAIDSNSSLSMCNLHPEKVKQLQQQDGHITKIIGKCKLKKNNKTPYYLDKHVLLTKN